MLYGLTGFRTFRLQKTKQTTENKHTCTEESDWWFSVVEEGQG